MNAAIDQPLLKGLQHWRQRVLQGIEDCLEDINEEYRDVQQQMAFAWQHSGEVDGDVVDFLWDELNSSVTEICKLERRRKELEEEQAGLRKGADGVR